MAKETRALFTLSRVDGGNGGALTAGATTIGVKEEEDADEEEDAYAYIDMSDEQTMSTKSFSAHRPSIDSFCFRDTLACSM